MKNISRAIALILTISFTIQPTLHAQLQKKNANGQGKLIERLQTTFRAFNKQLRCMISGRECSPEEKQKIRKTAYTIIALMLAALATYKGIRWRQRQPESPMSARPGERWTSRIPPHLRQHFESPEQKFAREKQLYENQRKAVDLMIQNNPFLNDNGTFTFLMRQADLNVQQKQYANALRNLTSAVGRATDLGVKLPQ